MTTYLFSGVILPERAPLTHAFACKFRHIVSNVDAAARVSIVLNQLAVWIETEHEWELQTLRNVVKTMVRTDLSIVGYVLGYAYDVEVTRVLNQEKNIDWVFGIDVPCLAERQRPADINQAINDLRKKVEGQNGVHLNRMFNDLTSAMKDADDCAFYCYRAIESLSNHCALRHGLSTSDKSARWRKFREVSSVQEKAILDIKDMADPLRHGGVATITSDQNATILMETWDIVAKYLATL